MPIPWKTLEIYRDLTSKVFKCNIRTNWIFQRSIKDVWRQIWYNIVGSHKHKYRLKVFWPGFNFGLQASPSSKAAQRWPNPKPLQKDKEDSRSGIRKPPLATGHPTITCQPPIPCFPKFCLLDDIARLAHQYIKDELSRNSFRRAKYGTRSITIGCQI